MQTIEISTLSDLMSRSYSYCATDIAPAPVVIPAAKQVAEYRTVRSNRAAILVASMVILALVDLNVVMWAGSIFAQIAEWIGASRLTSAWIDLIAMPAAIPVAAAFTRAAWRRIIR